MNPGLVVKLRPAGPWRIGPDSGARNRVDEIFHSDTLYSAVASAMLQLGMLEEWLAATARAETPAVCFSSCYPFAEEIDFIVPPRTVWPPQAPGMQGRVRWKSARFVPVEIVRSVLAGRRLDQDRWNVDGASECLVPAGRPGPFRTAVRWNAAVDRLTGNTERHSTACAEFREGAGLWTVVSFADEAARDRWQDPVKAAFRLLADTGFGGERSRGWGRAQSPEFSEGQLPELILPPFKPARKEKPLREKEPQVAGQPQPEEETHVEERPREIEEEPRQPWSGAVPPEPTPETAVAELALSSEPRPSGSGAVAAEPEPESAPETSDVSEAVPAEPGPDAAVTESALSSESQPEKEPRPSGSGDSESPEPVPLETSVIESVPEAAADNEPLPEPPPDPEPPIEEPDPVPPVEEPPESDAPVPPLEEPLEARVRAPKLTEELRADAVRPSSEDEPPASELEPVSKPEPDKEPQPEEEPRQTWSGEVETPVEDVPEPPAPEPLPANEPRTSESGSPEDAAIPQPSEEPAEPGAPKAQAYWLLSLFTPAPNDSIDWKRGDYSVVTRGGRVESNVRSGDPKKLLRMLAEGSVVYAAEPPKGGAVDVAPEGFPHPVYRAGYAVAIPLPEVR